MTYLGVVVGQSEVDITERAASDAFDEPRLTVDVADLERSVAQDSLLEH